jgi:chemotaxis protein methyltransferase CheR
LTRSAELPNAVRPLGPQEFEQIRQLAHRAFGLDLKCGKEELVFARLRRLVQAAGFHSFQQYYRHVLGDGTGAALVGMIDALATNHTGFLREREHFEFLRTQVAPMLAGREIVEVWSAACATGEEVWTIAMVLNEALPARRIRITATDISGKALEFAERGGYSAERCQPLPASWLSRYFIAEGQPPVAYRIRPELRAQALFRRVNLIEPAVCPHRFPAIFCRNVMIYFDKATQTNLVGRLAECLEPGGYLFVGHAESLSAVSHSLEYVQPAVYRKRRDGSG